MTRLWDERSRVEIPAVGREFSSQRRLYQLRVLLGHIQWVLEENYPGFEADHLLLDSAEFENEWSYNGTTLH